MKNLDKDKLHKEQLGLAYPKDYFSSMRNDLQQKLKLQELEAKHEEQLGMSVAPEYFEQNKVDLLAKLNAKESSITRSRVTKNHWFIGIAASIAILILLGVGFNSRQSENSFQNKIAQALVNEEDTEQMLVSSIFVEDQRFDAILDDYLLENMVLKSAVPVIESYDPTLESLFLDDQEVEGFLNELTTDTIGGDNEQFFE